MSLQQNKTIEKYIGKNYPMNLEFFKIFLQKNVQLIQQQHKIIQQKIVQFQFNQSFSQNDLRILLRLVAAIQYNKNQANKMNINQIQKCPYPLHFKSKKKQTQQNHKKIPVSEQIINVKCIQQNLSKSVDQNQIKNNIQFYPQQQDYKVQQNERHKNGAQQYLQKKQINQNQQSLPNINNANSKQEIKLGQISRAKISQYEKFSTDYVNTVIKFKVQYENNQVLRRYSQFQKLMKILSQKFQGYILPQMPSKQTIKSSMSYFWGTDSSYLDERKKKLEQLLNRLLQSKFVSSDQTLHKFLTDPGYQIQLATQGYAAYLKSFTDIVFNAKELKDYGLAYCNYLKQKDKKYQDIQQILKIFTDINQYRKKINTNFLKRKQLLKEQSIKYKQQEFDDFNKMMNKIQDQIKNLGTQFAKYRDLKCSESWIKQLIRQKTTDGSRGISQLTQEKLKLKTRIQKMETNLKIALDDFNFSKKEQIKVIGPKLLNWRKKVHP